MCPGVIQCAWRFRQNKAVEGEFALSSWAGVLVFALRHWIFPNFQSFCCMSYSIGLCWYLWSRESVAIKTPPHIPVSLENIDQSTVQNCFPIWTHSVALILCLTQSNPFIWSDCIPHTPPIHTPWNFWLHFLLPEVSPLLLVFRNTPSETWTLHKGTG